MESEDASDPCVSFCVRLFNKPLLLTKVFYAVTGIFADATITNYDGITVIAGGWVNRNFIQLGYQAANSAAILA